MLKRKPMVYQGHGQSTLNLGDIQNAVVCAPSQSTVRVHRADGLVALVAQDQATLEVKSGRASRLLVRALDQSTVRYGGDADEAKLGAFNQATVKVGRVASPPRIEESEQGSVSVGP
jgi:hypothetical protein